MNFISVNSDCRTGTIIQDICLTCPGCSVLDAVPVLVAAKLRRVYSRL